MRNVALDLGARKISFCEVLNGKVIARRTVKHLSELAPLLDGSTPKARVAIEACREAWHVHDVLTAWGHEVLLVDTTRVRQLGVGAHKRKTDRIDTEVLALAVERGTIPEAHVLSADRRELRTMLGVRAAVVATRSEFVTRIRGIARAAGTPIDPCSTEDFLPMLERATLANDVRMMIQPLRIALATIESQIVAVDTKLRERCAPDPVMQRLATAPGVGLIVAGAFVSVIDDAKRFNNVHQVAAYLGLVPSEDSSGNRQRKGAITKQGNPYLRAMLVQAGWTVLRSKDRDDPLVKWALATKKRRSNKIAAVAVARRLACILWAMWRRGTVYDAKLLARESASGLHRQAQGVEQQALALQRAASKLRGRKNKSTGRHANASA
jgi:transposase